MGYYNDLSLADIDARTADDGEYDRLDGLAELPLISVYTRQEALEDGALIDVSETAREAGFCYPVALTAALWADIEAIPAALRGIQDVAGRLWDVLHMARLAVRRVADARSEITYALLLALDGALADRLYQVKAVCGPDDDGAPCITLMKPDED